MEIITHTFWILFYIFLPLGIIYLTDRYNWVAKIGAVMVAYILGLAVGNLSLLPDSISNIQNIIISVTIPLAIPLLLFSSNLRMVGHLASKSLISLMVGLFSLTIVVIIGFLLFNNSHHEQFSKVGGLLVGVYSGGTPNLAALKLALEIEDELFLSINSYDMLISGVYLFFLMFWGKKVFGLVLKKFKSSEKIHAGKYKENAVTEPYWGLLKGERFLPLMAALGIAALIFGLSGGLMFLISGQVQMSVLIIAITSLSIVASFIPKVNKTEKAFELGMYLVLVFSVVIASKVNIFELQILNPSLFYYMTFVVFMSLVMHVIISKLVGVDTDTVIITSTALICSPPFVPVVATSIKNKELIVPGLTIGVIGYALGNYLGLAITKLLEML